MNPGNIYFESVRHFDGVTVQQLAVGSWQFGKTLKMKTNS